MSENNENGNDLSEIENEKEYEVACSMRADLTQFMEDLKHAKSHASRLCKKALRETLTNVHERIKRYEAKVLAQGGILAGPDDQEEEEEEAGEPCLAPIVEKYGRFPIRFRDEAGRDHYHGIAVPWPNTDNQEKACAMMVMQAGNQAEHACRGFKEKFNMDLQWSGLSPQDYRNLSAKDKANVVLALGGHRPNSYFVVRDGKGMGELTHRLKEETDV